MIDTMVKSVETSAGAAAGEEFFEPHHDAYTDCLFVLLSHDLVELAD